ncbi:MAG: glycerol-3-phosphate dehydrogenase/oxidase [Flavobacteriaceae bacterium]|nr:glycerol-3-phosphate dehydrogenase/oxidase [Flavobacteriaceae bacterium]
MNRKANIDRVVKQTQWDVVIIGGGASGLGIAVDAAQRGYRTLLLEQHDFAKGTSSRSTKLVHGGVRYLQNGDVSLVIEALKERGLMKRNAPHLVRDMSFVIPIYSWWNGPFYTIGLKIYDMMAGDLGLGKSQWLDKTETTRLIQNVNEHELRGGVVYHDGQFDDARMAISLALTADQQGACILNYTQVTGLIQEDGLVCGLHFVDHLSGQKHAIRSNVVINATGVFSDTIMKMDEPEAQDRITPSQGIHLVLDREFLQGSHAIMIPQTTDGRVLFAVPWHDHVILGTTDTLIDSAVLEPQALDQEIDFVLNNAAQYMHKKPKRSDVKSVFAGLRPLAASAAKDGKTKEISRHHKVHVSTSGLVSVLGGKWTTYRKMAEDTLNAAAMVGGLDTKKCKTKKLKLFGHQKDLSFEDPLHVYGTERETLMAQGPEDHNASLSNIFYISVNQILYSIRHEMAITLEDIIARRVRCLFLDAKETLRLLPRIAHIMAQELNRDEHWEAQELEKTEQLVKNYIL